MAKANPTRIDAPPQDLTGQTFHRLTVLSLAEIRRPGKGRKRCYWFCSCSCGGTKRVEHYNLTGGLVKSCGCIHEQHGKSQAPEYRVWARLIGRCTDPKDKGYRHYGGRGIHVCERWLNSFAAFLTDMGARPSPRHSIDRIDTFGNYEPGNCRWATKIEQARNARSNRLLTYNGETLCLAEWAERFGISGAVLHHRLKAGRSLEEAFTMRLNHHDKKLPRFTAEQLLSLKAELGTWDRVAHCLGISRPTLRLARRKAGLIAPDSPL